MTDSFDENLPLAFKIREGAQVACLRSSQDGQDTIQVEARQMSGHQKEAIVTEGEGGSAWRLPSDEGKHLKGTDLAPFPLGYFNAGMQGDLFQRIRQLFFQQEKTLRALDIELVNHYWLTGSFALGTGQGHAEPTDIRIRVDSDAQSADVAKLVRLALQQSPAVALLRTPIENTFALYINGRRRLVTGIPQSPAGNAADPFLTYRSAPLPLDAAAAAGTILKSARSEGSYPLPTPTGTPPRTIRNVHGRGHLDAQADKAEMESWLELPDASHFQFMSGVQARTEAPSGLALLSAGIAFCYMTQLARYIDTMKMAIKGVRLVQFNPYSVQGGQGRALPIDTHLFLNGEAPDETHLLLLQIAARTCYLHATAAAQIEPVVEIFHRGVKIH